MTSEQAMVHYASCPLKEVQAFYRQSARELVHPDVWQIVYERVRADS